jgi:undecaprenyl diphosphate synthase
MINHLACIMDGNRRWAQSQGLLPWYGHQEGVEAAYRVIDFCTEKKITYLSLYLFALQNFKRPTDECEHIFEMLRKHSNEVLKQLIAKNIHVKFIGDHSSFPQGIGAIADMIEEATRSATGLKLNLLFCYGAQEEIVAACKAVAQEVAEGKYSAAQIDQKRFESHLWSAKVPHPDLIIRTGKTHRLSNFLLYQAAYSELYFSDCLWPEIDYAELEKAYLYFESCARNFGK